MAKTIRPVNGAIAEQLTAAALDAPVVAVKSEAQLLLEAEIARLKADRAGRAVAIRSVPPLCPASEAKAGWALAARSMRPAA